MVTTKKKKATSKKASGKKTVVNKASATKKTTSKNPKVKTSQQSHKTKRGENMKNTQELVKDVSDMMSSLATEGIEMIESEKNEKFSDAIINAIDERVGLNDHESAIKVIEILGEIRERFSYKIESNIFAKRLELDNYRCKLEQTTKN
jgi:hypothetical protein